MFATLPSFFKSAIYPQSKILLIINDKPIPRNDASIPLRAKLNLKRDVLFDILKFSGRAPEKRDKHKI